jgi:outer membrane lipopolysaccharide assembly protein LptE/RlpB
MKRIFVAAALSGAILLTSCGYALVGRASSLPAHVKTIHVPAFVNRTTRVELEQRVTAAVGEEMVSRGRLRLVSSPGDADSILRGAIESFRIDPVAFNPEGRATQYQISVTAKIELLDHRNDDQVIWKNDHYFFTENYRINLDAIDAFDQETRAINEIARRFAEALVASLMEGF